MILFFFGDAFALREKQSALKKAFFQKNPNSSGFFEFDFSEMETLNPLASALEQVGLFAPKKFVVVGNVFDAPIDMRRLLAEFIGEKSEKLSQDENRIVLFWSNGQPKKVEKLWKALSKKEIRREEFFPLSGLSLLKWIDGRVVASGAQRIESVARKILAEGFLYEEKKFEKNRQVDVFRLDMEIQKLGNYRRGEIIHKEDVYMLSSLRVDEGTIFDALDALFSGKKEQALKMFFRDAKTPDILGLLGMCAWQLRNILRTKGAMSDGRVRNSMETAKLLGIHPFPAEKCFRIASRFSLSDLEAMFARLVVLDREAKNGDRDPESALVSFVMMS